jgi:eukaryotic-like serine/threonine-protein kinase
MSDGSRRVRFGTFELDLRSGDLWRAGRRRTLQEQPLAVLVVLLEHPGDVVRRDDLCALLWPDGTFVDFEHGLNAAVKRLRDSLGTDPEATGLIETVPRRGYRFTAAVELVEDPKPEPGPKPTPPRTSWLTTWRAVGASIALILTGGGVALYAWLRVGSAPAEAGRVANSPHLLAQVTYETGWATQPAISPDGQFVAYASDRGQGDNLSIWVQRLDGGAPRQLTHQSLNDIEPAFSPDGSRIAFRSDRSGGGIYTIPAHSGGQEERLVSGGHEPRYSPDGRYIAYWTGAPQPLTCDPLQNRVFVVSSQGGVPKIIGPEFIGACWPVWAPDSKHLLVAVLPKPDADLRWLVVPIDGGAAVDTGLSELGRRYGFSCIPHQFVWVGNRLVFGMFRDNPMNLWVTTIDADTWRVASTAEQITTGPEHQAHASMANDGQLMIGSYSHKVALWSLPVVVEEGRTRAAPRRLTEGLQLDRVPTASLDGSVAFTRLAGKGDGICMLDSKTSVQTMKVPSGPDIMNPSISPDGSKIAYWHSNAIKVISAERAEPELVSTCAGVCLPEGWSRDNARLLYEDAAGGDWQVFVLSLKSGAKRLLAARSGHSLLQARFSPDERWLSFMEYAGTHSRLWVAPVPASGLAEPRTWIPVTSDAWLEDKPRWSPDGQLLYFLSDRDGFRCIWAQRLGRSSRRPVGAAFAVHHIHGGSLSMMNVMVQTTGFDVARDSLIFNMGERAGNIWTTMLDPKP